MTDTTSASVKRETILKTNPECYPKLTHYTITYPHLDGNKTVNYGEVITNHLHEIEKDLLYTQSIWILEQWFLQLHMTAEIILQNLEHHETQEFITALQGYIHQDYKSLKENLEITTLDDFDEIVHIYKLTSILMKSAAMEDNIEALFEAHAQMKSRLNKEHLLKVE